jgi:hypothetical protein
VYCGLATTIVETPDEVKAFPFACRCWSCESCFQRRLWQLKQLALAGYPSKFLTLTSVRNTERTADQAAVELVHAWRMIRQRAKREGLADKIEYLAIFEETEKGWPHLHILMRSPYIDQEWLSDRMREYNNSPNVWITDIKSQKQVARYIAKYVSKGPGRYEGTKRYFKSKNYVIDESYLERKASTCEFRVWVVDRDLSSVLTWFAWKNWSVTQTVGDAELSIVPMGGAEWPQELSTFLRWGHDPPSGEVPPFK